MATNRCTVCPTRHVCIAAEATEDQLEQLPSLFRCVDSLATNDHLFFAGDIAQAQYHVRSGMLKTYVINTQGDEHVTGFYLPGEILGQVHENGRYTESAVALESVSVCELSDKALGGCAEVGLAPALIKRLADNASTAMYQQINLKQTLAQSRFAGFCIMFAERLAALGRCPNHIPTPMSRTDIASYLGMTLESLSRVMSKLQAAKVIRAARDHIEILQPETLETLGLHVNH